MPTIKELALQMSESFVRDKRHDGKEFVNLRDGSPRWMTAVCFDAHGDMLPDDYRYEFIEEAVDAISEFDDVEEARDSIEADIYTHELTSWLGSRADRCSYVDDACEEYGIDAKTGVIERIQLGQLMEKQEVFDLVLASLRALADENGGN